MSNYLFWFLIFLPLPLAVAFFVFSKKSQRRGYLLGLIPIFLFWQIISLIFLWKAKTPCEEYCGFFETAAGSFTLILIVSYTVLGLGVRRIYRRAARKTQIPGRSLHSMAAVELPIFLAILSLSLLCGLGLFGFTRWSIEINNPFIIPVFWLGYGYYILLKLGIAAFIVTDVLILALFWILYTRIGSKEQEHPPLESTPDSGTADHV